MTKRQEIVLAVYDGFELLDMAGPASVFNMADKVCGADGYRITLVSVRGGGITANSGVTVETKLCSTVRLGARDTVLVVGADEGPIDAAQIDDDLLAFMRRAESQAGRYGSVCTGAFVAAAAGLLEGRRSATHWRDANRLRQTFPNVQVDEDRLYINDGRLWSSAGISSGVDMALAMVEQDHGPAVRSRVAKRLVVYAHRPGTQSQFSAILETQAAVDDRFADVVAWTVEHLAEPIGVRDMAKRAGMSERSFYRRFAQAVGSTPARFLENARLDKAKQLLEAGAAVKTVPRQVGFQSESGFRAAFEARYRISPSHHRLMHGTSKQS
ncbi:MAG: helix-turn-helix domain-containing protein [Pseudomonadota bacterium]